MDEMAVIQRAINALTHRVRRMAYREGGTNAERDAFHANRILRAYWIDKTGRLSPEEEVDISQVTSNLINRTKLNNPGWRAYQEAHGDQIVTLSADSGSRLEVAIKKVSQMTWREFAEDQIARMKQDFYDREVFVQQALDEESQDPIILFHQIERAEILEITGLVTEADVKQIETYDTDLPDWRDRLEAVYYSNFSHGVIYKQFAALLCDYFRQADPNDGILHLD